MSTYEERTVPPRYAAIGRDALRLLKSQNLRAAHALTVDRATDKLTLRANWNQSAALVPKGELEIAFSPVRDSALVVGFDTKGVRRLSAEYTGIAPGLVLTAKGVHLQETATASVGTPVATTTSASPNSVLLGLRYERAGFNAEFSTDVLPTENSQHQSVINMVTAYERAILGARLTVALTPPKPVDDSAPAYLVGYDLAGSYRLNNGELIFMTKSKLNVVHLGYRVALTPYTEAGALMKHRRGLAQSTMRIVAATRYEDMTLRGAVDTKGRLRASISAPMGGAVGTLVIQTGLKPLVTVPEAKIGIQVAL